MKVCLRTAGLLALVALACPTAAGAQTWPTKPIEWIVPFAPGGSTDVLARLVAEKLKDRLGQPILIVNRGGANGDIGYKAAAAAAPDGHTIVLTVPALVTNPFQLKAALDPSRLAPVIYLAEGPYVMLASQKFPATTIQEAIARIQAKPGSVSCGMTGGTGSVACQALQVVRQEQVVGGALSRRRAGDDRDHGGRHRSGVQLLHHGGAADQFRPRQSPGDDRAEARFAAVPRTAGHRRGVAGLRDFSAGAGLRFRPERRRTSLPVSTAK